MNFLFGDFFLADDFKYEIILLFIPKDMIKFVLDMASNHVRDKEKPQCKIYYKVSKEKVRTRPIAWYISISNNN